MKDRLTIGTPVLCVGIDPHRSVLEAWGVPDSAEGLGHFVHTIVPLILDSGCSVVKPQVAFFERHGVAGMHALALLLGDLRSHGIVTIGDAKRGDIGSTMEGYAQAWLTPGSDFEVDALTVVPYQGVGALEPALALAAEHSKGVFVLSATSNPEAWDLASWVTRHPSTVSTHGVVVGATLTNTDFGLDMANYPGMPILAPGFGHQGAALSSAKSLFPETSPVVAVVARSVLLRGEEGFVAAVQTAEKELSL